MTVRGVWVVALAWALCGRPVYAQLGRFSLPGRTQRAPTQAEREFTQGETRLRAGDVAGARAHFETARRLDPRDARPPFYLGEVALREDRLQDAEGLYRASLALDPRLAEAHAELGVVLRELHRLPEAITSLETALRLSSTLGEAHYTLGLCLEDQGNAPRAVQEYRTAVRLLSDDPLPSLNLGLLLAGQRPAPRTPQRYEAVRALQDAVRRGGQRVEVLLSAGPALRALGEYRAAADTLERARTLGTPTSALLGELGQALWAAGDRAAGERRVSEALRGAPGDASLHYVRALMLADSNRPQEAIRELREVVRLGAGTPLEERARARLQQLGARGSAPP